MSELKKILDQIVASLPNREPGDVILHISKLAAAAGNEVCEALLAAHPELYEARPILTEAYRGRILKKESAIVEELLGLRPQEPYVIRDLLSETGQSSLIRQRLAKRPSTHVSKLSPKLSQATASHYRAIFSSGGARLPARLPRTVRSSARRQRTAPYSSTLASTASYPAGMTAEVRLRTPTA